MSEQAELSISHAVGAESWILTVADERGACAAPDGRAAEPLSAGGAGHPVTCSTERLGTVITVPADSVSGACFLLGDRQELGLVQFVSPSRNLHAYVVRLLKASAMAVPAGGWVSLRLARREFPSLHGRIISFVVPELSLS